VTCEPGEPTRYTGVRIRIAAGRAFVLPASPIPDGMINGCVSVLSPGSERRRLTATINGPSRHSGYMTLGQGPQGWVLAPAPHGASFAPDLAGALTVPPGTDVHIAALARFALIASTGLDRLPAAVDLTETVVVGSGPIALGCALELHRRGATHIRVLTSRRHAPIGRVPGVELLSDLVVGSVPLAIDAVGRADRAATFLSPGCTLGLLGTPTEHGILSALAVHRGGWTVVGMHELAPAIDGRYQLAYTRAATWITSHVDAQSVASWCRRVPGDDAPRIFETLGGPDRPAEPVIIFEWQP
jgi:hypothetical protein